MTHNLLLTTILNRPYVVAFLVAYIVIAIRVTNLRWTVLYLLAGYTIAFASEYLSINTGFPYGWYFYKYENLRGEWLNHGVPVWDSVSYVFMCFAGLCVAKFALRRGAVPAPGSGNPTPTRLIIFSAVFTTILDVIVDPVAHLGKYWFLGDIYYYPNPGIYFDVTLTNFAGWFLVSFLINSVGVYAFKFNRLCNLSKINTILALGLYYGIAAFGIAIAIYLNQWMILLADVLWVCVTVILITRTTSANKNQYLEK